MRPRSNTTSQQCAGGSTHHEEQVPTGGRVDLSRVPSGLVDKSQHAGPYRSVQWQWALDLRKLGRASAAPSVTDVGLSTRRPTIGTRVTSHQPCVSYARTVF